MDKDFEAEVTLHLKRIYKGININKKIDVFAKELINIIGKNRKFKQPEIGKNLWSEKDIMLIAYGNSINSPGHEPLKTLGNFASKHYKDLFSILHILPFFPYSSDDGFAVKDYYKVDNKLGDWKDINKISKDFRLMSDLVINHISSESEWFENFLNDNGKGKDYFLIVDKEIDLNKVFRPRANDIEKPVKINGVDKNVWCTFGHDQIDFDFSNPDVLKEFVSIIKFYLDNGVKLFRLDAIAFIWKQKGTRCINLNQTHEIIRLFRTLIDHCYEDIVLLTETNILKRENLTYFGNSNEAHWIYNFSLPPILIYTMITGDCTRLVQWSMTMPPSQNGTAYLNFISSHDGIGLRPAEGILNQKELDLLVSSIVKLGGKISSRKTPQGKLAAYEMNITVVDALSGDKDGFDEFSLERFMCAHAIMLSLEGVPAIYFNALVGTKNDYVGLEKTKMNRSINRFKWKKDELSSIMVDKNSQNFIKFNALKRLISIRKNQKAFHPNASQFTLQLNKKVFGFYRQSTDREQTIFCLSNVSNKYHSLSLIDLNIKISGEWKDLISEDSLEFDDNYLHLKPYQTVWLSNL